MPLINRGKLIAPAIALMVSFAILTFTGCLGGGGGGGGTGGTSISISGFAYVPANITVSVGTTVTWTNNDPVDHTVTTDPGAPVAFDSGTISTGSHFSHTFSVAGTYHVHCTIHTFIHGVVIVQ